MAGIFMPQHARSCSECLHLPEPGVRYPTYSGKPYKCEDCSLTKNNWQSRDGALLVGVEPWEDKASYQKLVSDLAAEQAGPDFGHEETDVVVVNPKELAGAKKPAIWNVVPRWVVLLVGRVMSVGAAKYGRFNYRDSNVSAMTYVDAMERHLQLWQDGEEVDEETGVSHLASVMAGCTILLDAQANDRMGDDRPKTGLVRKTLNELQGLLTSLPLPAPQY